MWVGTRLQESATRIYINIGEITLELVTVSPSENRTTRNELRQGEELTSVRYVSSDLVYNENGPNERPGGMCRIRS